LLAVPPLHAQKEAKTNRQTICISSAAAYSGSVTWPQSILASPLDTEVGAVGTGLDLPHFGSKTKSKDENKNKTRPFSGFPASAASLSYFVAP